MADNIITYRVIFDTTTGTNVTGQFTVNYSLPGQGGVGEVLQDSVYFQSTSSTGWVQEITPTTAIAPRLGDPTSNPNYSANSFQFQVDSLTADGNYQQLFITYQDSNLDGTVTYLYSTSGDGLYYNNNADPNSAVFSASPPFTQDYGAWPITDYGSAGQLQVNGYSAPTSAPDYNSDTFLTTIPTCFLPGTLIYTPTGSIPVQDLAIGDLILNHAGQSVPVKWIGTQRFHRAFIGDSLPICIIAGALGNGLPLRDLYVSPRHALYIDDCLLIEAQALVNGTTITQVTQWEGDVQYLHIETEHHEIILAEGAPAETFMDNVSRANFNNYSEYKALYPEAHEMIELEIPRVSHRRQLPNAVKAKLEAISEGLICEVKVQMAG